MRINHAPAGVDDRPTMNFIPFGLMTVAEQAEHLVHAHGYDAEWMRYIDGWSTDQECVASFMDDDEGRRFWHQEDHAEFEHGGATRLLHTHAKHTT